MAGQTTISNGGCGDHGGLWHPEVVQVAVPALACDKFADVPMVRAHAAPFSKAVGPPIVTACVGNGPAALQRQAEQSLRALTESGGHAVAGAQAVAELRTKLAELQPRLGVDIREVQESLVQHAAMYTSCPEVLRGMLRLVSCLDVVRSWQLERDASAVVVERRLEALEEECRQHSAVSTALVAEVQRLGECAAAQALAVDLEEAARAAAEADAHAETAARVTDATEELRREVAILHSQLLAAKRRAAEAETAERRIASEFAAAGGGFASPAGATAKTAIGQESATRAPGASPAATALSTTASATSQQTPWSPGSEEGLPSQAMLATLEQMEPMLAALPAHIVPGMAELQEEACEAYSHLRSVVLKMTSIEHPPVAVRPGRASLCGGVPWASPAAVGRPSGSAPAMASRAGRTNHAPPSRNAPACMAPCGEQRPSHVSASSRAAEHCAGSVNDQPALSMPMTQRRQPYQSAGVLPAQGRSSAYVVAHDSTRSSSCGAQFDTAPVHAADVENWHVASSGGAPISHAFWESVEPDSGRSLLISGRCTESGRTGRQARQ